ncbi:MAG: hypothetical protein M3430_20855 [Acidobacteriota bacterium]|nr:hypothetical protein [Acidobacteriota bacterium]
MLLVLIATPVIFQRLGDLRKDAEDQMQAALMSMLLKFHGSQPREETTPQNGHRQINRNATEICAETFPERKTKKASVGGKLVSAKRGSGAARNSSVAEPVKELQSWEPAFVAVADANVDIKALADVRAVAQPTINTALEDLPDVEVAHDVSVTTRRMTLPRVLTKTAALHDVEMNSFPFAPALTRQTRVILKHAAELEKEVQRKAWWQDLIKNQRKISESVKAKLCAEAARKENEARAQERESHRIVFVDDEQPFEVAVSEE